jgi:hypothetical protein
MKTLSNRIFLLVLVGFWYLALTFGYYEYVLRIEPMGWFEPTSDWLSRLLLLLGVLVVMVFLLPRDISSPSDFYIYFLFVTGLVPTILLYILQGGSGEFLSAIICSYFLIVGLCRLKLSLSNPRLRHGRKIAFAICGICLAMFFARAVSTGAFSNLNLNLFKVYEVRANESAFSGYFGYLLTSCAFTIGPFLIAYSMYMKKPVLLISSTGLQVLFFAMSGDKIFLVSSGMVVGVSSLFYFRASIRAYLLLLGASLLVVSSVILAYLVEYEIVGSMFVRRIFFVPARLNFFYYEFFSVNPHTYLSHLIPLADYPYLDDYGLIIGDFSGKPGGNATNGFLGSAFMHFGYLGLFMFSTVIAITFKIADYLAKHSSTLFVVAATVVPFRVMLIESDLSTSMLTGGVLLSLILSFLFVSERASRY